jgi:hypothetical protein
MFLFYILENITLTNIAYCLKIHYQIVFQNFKLSFTSTLQFPASALLSLIIGSYKTWCQRGLQLPRKTVNRLKNWNGDIQWAYWSHQLTFWLKKRNPAKKKRRGIICLFTGFVTSHEALQADWNLDGLFGTTQETGNNLLTIWNTIFRFIYFR